jgi:SAM-dependent methyltransferase
VVVDAAAVAAGEQVLDVACGTGNAALVAAARGAAVTGLDAAERLVGVARERAAAAGLEAEWLVGDAQALPFEDARFDAAVSVFGVIFAPDARRAAAELVRVVRPGGRIVLTAWIDRGPISELMRASRAWMPAPPEGADADADARAWVNWSDPALLGELFAGAEVVVEERALPFTGESPRAWVEEQARHHPAWSELSASVPADRRSAFIDELTGILAAGNEDPDALRVTSPYIVVRISV